MTFHVFAEQVAEALQAQLGKDCEVRLTEVTKNNGVCLTGVVLKKMTANVAPAIYLNDAYQEYLAGKDIEGIVSGILHLYKEQIRDIKIDVNFFTDFEKVKGRIFYRLVHFGRNKNMLEQQPFFRWKDLAVTFYYEMEEGMFDGALIAITKQHMGKWNQTAESLYQAAQVNMKEKKPELLIPMKELLQEMTGTDMQRKDTHLYVLTNQEKWFGASALLYSEKMEGLAQLLECDLLILPSSVHEVLLLPDRQDRDYGFYKKMVREVNESQVIQEEFLSENIYRYDRKKKEIEEIYS